MAVVEAAAGDTEGVAVTAEMALPNPGKGGGWWWWDGVQGRERDICCEVFGVVKGGSESGGERGPGGCAWGADLFVLAEADVGRSEDRAGVSYSGVFVGHGDGGCANGEGEEGSVEVIQPCYDESAGGQCFDQFHC